MNIAVQPKEHTELSKGEVRGHLDRPSVFDEIVVASVAEQLPMLGKIQTRQLNQLAAKSVELLQKTGNETCFKAATQLQEDIGLLSFFRNVSQNVKKA